MTDTQIKKQPKARVEPSSHTAKPRRRFSFGFDRFSGIYLFLTFVVVFGTWKPDLFLTMNTLHLVASQQAVSAMLALAVLIPLACGAYDLSIGATINLSAVSVAVLQTREHWGMWPAIFAAILIGLVIGIINGLIVVRLKVNSFIATLGTATIVGAVQVIVSGGNQPFPPAGHAWAQLTQHKIAGFQIIVLYMLVLAVILWWFLARTPAGRYIYAIGSNPEAARLSGLRTGRWTWVSLAMSGALSALAGVLYCSQLGPSLTFGPSLLLPAYAAVFLGSTQFIPGRFNVWGTLLAIYVLATGVQGLQFVTSVQWLNDMFNGIALIVAVAFAVWRQNAAKKRVRVEAATTDTPDPERGPPDPMSTISDPTPVNDSARSTPPSTTATQGI
jgi:ribose transport system permease protein